MTILDEIGTLLDKWEQHAITNCEYDRLCERPDADYRINELRFALDVAKEDQQGLVYALEKIRDADWVDNCLDPQWPSRVAKSALDDLPT